MIQDKSSAFLKLLFIDNMFIIKKEPGDNEKTVKFEENDENVE